MQPVKKAIFPVAGLGTRFPREGAAREMMPVVDKPLIQYAVEEAYAAGVREMILSPGATSGRSRDHFDMTFRLEVSLEANKRRSSEWCAAASKPKDMECIYVRQAQARQAWATRCQCKPVAGRQRPLRGAAGRRPDDRRARRCGADGRPVQRMARVHPGGAGSAGRVLNRGATHRRRARWSTAPDGCRSNMVEAGARSRAVAAGRCRWHPDARGIPRDQPRGVGGEIQSPMASPRCCADEGVRLPLRRPPLRLRQ